MANDQVEVFDNTIEQNQTAGLTIVSYMIMEKPLNDSKYDPFCESIHVHDNRFSGSALPSGTLGEMLGKVLWTPLPDILYDGVADPAKQVDGKLPAALALHIHDNGGAGFVNFDAPALTATARPAEAPKFVRDLKGYDGTPRPTAGHNRGYEVNAQGHFRELHARTRKFAAWSALFCSVYRGVGNDKSHTRIIGPVRSRSCRNTPCSRPTPRPSSRAPGSLPTTSTRPPFRCDYAEKYRFHQTAGWHICVRTAKPTPSSSPLAP